MGRVRAAILAGFLLILGGGPAFAAGAMAYSAADEYYGWAAGYDSQSRAATEAVDGCQSGGGQDCKFVLACPGGYGSVAYADDSATGVGMACNLKDATTARTFALYLCVAVSNALCWTTSTFDDDGDELPTSTNEPFDMTYYAQEMLAYFGYYTEGADGEMGPKTREAIRVLQAEIGWPVDGELDFELFWVMMDLVGGPQSLAASYVEFTEDMRAALPDVTFAVAAAPFPRITFSEEIARRDDNWRRQAMAAQLFMQGQKCSIPAVMAEAIPPDGTGGWHVRCAEGDYTIVMGPSTIVMEGFGEIRSDATGVTVIPPGAEAPALQPDPPAATPPSAPPARGGSKLGH